jgi:hypothetical protein
MDVQAGGMCGNSELVKLEMLVSTEIMYVCLFTMEFEQCIVSSI